MSTIEKTGLVMMIIGTSRGTGLGAAVTFVGMIVFLNSEAIIWLGNKLK